MNKTPKKVLTLGLVGCTQTGKTTAALSQSQNPVELCLKYTARGARTKIPTDFVLSSDTEVLRIRNIILNDAALIGNKVEQYNRNLTQATGLTSLLGLKPADPDSNIHDLHRYVKSHQDSSLVNITDEERIFKILSDDDLSAFVRRIQLDLPVYDELRCRLNEKGLELVLRDTRGLMDLTTEKGGDGKLSIKADRLTDVGMDNLDGVLFFCSSQYPNSIDTLYNDLIKTVFASVPCFLASRSELFLDSCSDVESVDFAPDMNNTTVQRKLRILFRPTYEFLAGTGKDDKDAFRIMEPVPGVRDCYQFKNHIAPMEKMIQIISTLSCSMEAYANTDDSNSDENIEWTLFQRSVTHLLCNVSETILNYRSAINALVEEKHIEKALLSDEKKWFDYAKLNYFPMLSPIGSQTYTIEDLDLNVKQDQAFLGPYGGITTRSHGSSWRYAPAVIGAVGAYCTLMNNANNCEVTWGVKSICEKFGVTSDSILAYWRGILLFVLYSIALDSGASANGYPILDRFLIKDALEQMRNEPSPFLSAVYRATKIATDKCNTSGVIQSYWKQREMTSYF